MAGIAPYLERGPSSYVASSAITGGQLVMPDTGGTIKTATAGAATVLGVAGDDANTAAVAASATSNYGSLRPDVKVYTAPAEVRVTAAATVNFGVKVKAAASGQVTPWIGGTDNADLIVGHCTEPAGIASAGTGRIKLH